MSPIFEWFILVQRLLKSSPNFWIEKNHSYLMSNSAHEILVENEVDQKRTKLRQFLIHAIPMLNPSGISLFL